MITQMMVQPSSWVESGIQISKVRNLLLFKFTTELQSRLEELSDKRKALMLTDSEEAELAGINEYNTLSYTSRFKTVKSGWKKTTPT